MQEFALILGALILFAVVIVATVISTKRGAERKRVILDSMPEEQKRDLELTRLHGRLNSPLVCPHCQTKGTVRTKPIVQKKGVSGGKATGALLTGGASLLATGLSRKEDATEAYCENCQSVWIF